MLLPGSGLFSRASLALRAATFVAVAAGIVSSAPRVHAADTTPPRLAAFEISPRVVDITDDPADLLLNCRVMDDEAGYKGGYCTFASESGGSLIKQFGPPHVIPAPVNPPPVLDAWYQTGDILWKGFPVGRYDLTSFTLYDNNGNTITYGPAEGQTPFPAAVDTSFEVKDDRPDSESPQLVSVDFEPKHVDASEYQQTITLTTHLTDDAAGVAEMWFVFQSPSGAQSVNSAARPVIQKDMPAYGLAAGTRRDGTWIAQVNIPHLAEVGAWTLTVYIRDRVDKYASYGAGTDRPWESDAPAQLMVAPIVEATSATYITSQSALAAQVTLVRGGDPRNASRVRFNTSDGTATSGRDFSPVSVDVLFAAGEKTKKVAIPLLPGATRGDAQEFNVALSSPRKAVLGSQTRSKVRLADPSAPSEIQWGADSYKAWEGQGAVALTLVRTGLAGSSATVRYTTRDGSAQSGADYVKVSRSVTFLPGQRSKRVVVLLAEDLNDEADEDFSVILTGASGATLPQPTARVSLLDNDPAPSAYLHSGAIVVAENVGYAVLYVSLRGFTARPATVRYQISEDTARAGSDYIDVSGEVTFLPGGVRTHAIRIPIIDDKIAEPTKSFRVALSGSDTALIAHYGIATVTITDRDTGR